MITMRIEHAAHGREIQPGNPSELRATRVNGRTEMLPSDPRQVAKILKERRNSTPAAKVKAKIAADLKKRGIK
jgi:hypothetical protein